MLWTLLVATGIAGPPPAEKVRELERDGKHERALDYCEKSLGRSPDESELMELCASVAWRFVEEDLESLEAFAAKWPGTTAGQRAHRQAGVFAVEAAGDDPEKLRQVAESYAGTRSAEEAERRLTHQDFIAARDAGDAASMVAFVEAHPDAVHLAMAHKIIARRTFEETAAVGTVAAWTALLEAWPDHPQLSEAQGALADALYAEARSPEELYAFSQAHPEHPKTPEALGRALPVLVSLTHQDEDLEVANPALTEVSLVTPSEATVSLRVGEIPVAEACADSPEVTFADGALRYPFGLCQLDAEPLTYRVRVEVLGVSHDLELTVEQAPNDPLAALALRYALRGQLQAGCEDPARCAPTQLGFAGDLLYGVQGEAYVDEEVRWWALDGVQGPAESPPGPAGVWRGPLSATTGLALSPDGQRLAAAFCGEALTAIYLVDIASDRILGTRDGTCGRDLTFSRDGESVLLVDGDQVVVLASRNATTTWEFPGGGEVRQVAWSPDGEVLAWWSEGDGQEREPAVNLGGAASEIPFTSHATGEVRPHQLDFTADGETLCLLTESAYRCWDRASEEEVRSVDLSERVPEPPEGETSPRGPVAMAPDLDLVVVGTAEGTVTLWDGRSGEQLTTLTGGQGPITSLALSATGDRIAAVDETGALWLWGAQSR